MASTADNTVPLVDTGIARINGALHQLLDGGHVPSAGHVAVGHTLFVCDATEHEWAAYVENDYDQAYPSRLLWWCGGTQQILMVEFPGKAHAYYVSALDDAIRHVPIVRDALRATLASYDDTDHRYEPDLSYGPFRDLVELHGASPPNGTSWSDFKTIRIEVGVSQGWGQQDGQLDLRALDVWAHRACIAYVLCVHVAEDSLTANYKLYDFTQGQAPAFQDPPTAIVAPTTVVRLNSRRIMGLPDGAPLPAGFPEPAIQFDLYAALVRSRRMLNM